ncbi:MAG: cytochrome d ubiquinol oxidase subunit II [Chitinophagales bacterium]
METFIGIDYPTWWFLIVGAVFSGYAVLDGFDFGAGAWHLFFKKEKSRRIALNAIGPVWDGNEVWLVIGGGALFAGFPVVYATILSGMYIPFMLFLMFIILRAISIEFRSKEKMLWWRKMWDVTYSISSIMLALMLGIILGNVLQGFPLQKNQELSVPLLDVLNPFSLLVGATTLALFMMHGAIYLTMKTEGRLFAKLTILLKRAIIAFVVLFSISTVYTLIYIPHLSDKFKEFPALFIVPLMAILSIANIPRLTSKRKYFQAFLFSSLAICLLFIIVAIELYPVILFSTIDPQYHITVYDAASSIKTLKIMLTFAAIGVPLIASYTFFVYRTFRGVVKLDETSY